MNKLGILENIQQESGFILPDGKIEYHNPKTTEHVEIAIEKLRYIKGPWQGLLEQVINDPEYVDECSDGILSMFEDHFNVVRYGSWKKRMYIQFTSLTFDQLGTIRRKALENEKFDYHGINPYCYGTTLRDLHQDVYSKGFLQ